MHWKRNVIDRKKTGIGLFLCLISDKKSEQALLVPKWSGRRDSNSRRSPWQGDALPLSHSRIIYKTLVVPPGGIEPPTQGFSVPCSTD